MIWHIVEIHLFSDKNIDPESENKNKKKKKRIGGASLGLYRLKYTDTFFLRWAWSRYVIDPSHKFIYGWIPKVMSTTMFYSMVYFKPAFRKEYSYLTTSYSDVHRFFDTVSKAIEIVLHFNIFFIIWWKIYCHELPLHLTI